MNPDLLREMLRRHEGLRLRPYSCSAGKQTIGYGWNMTANALPPEIQAHLHLYGRITGAMSDRLLNISLDTATRQAWSIFPDFGAYTENRQHALIDMIFNMGAAGVLKFRKMLAAVFDGDWNAAADEAQDSVWFRQVGNRAVEVVKMLREG